MPTEKIEGENVVPNKVVFDPQVLESLHIKYKDYFDKHNKRMEEKFGEFFNAYLTPEIELRPYFEDLELRDGLLENKTILDLGSANHFFDDYCRQKYASNVVALDINEDSLGKQHDLGVVADALALPFADSIFDLIISHASMPHLFAPREDDDGNLILIEGEVRENSLQDILNVFRETYRALKTGGQTRMSTFSEGEELSQTEYRRLNNLLPHTTELNEQQFTRIKLVKEALEIFEKESGARCMFKDEKKGGLIVIKK